VNQKKQLTGGIKMRLREVKGGVWGAKDGGKKMP